MTDSGGRSARTGRWLWRGAFVLAAGAFACSVIAFGPGHGWAAVAAAAAAVVLLAVLEVLARADRATVEDAGFLHEKYVQLARDQEQCREALRRQAGEAMQREQAHHRVLASLDAVQLTAGHVTSAVIPAALAGDPLPPAPRDTGAGDGEAWAVFGPVVTAVAEGSARLRAQLDERAESSRLAVVMLARRVQASAHRIQEEATSMAESHPGDADVLASSMRVDHAAAQQARHAQSAVVLCGEWPAQQWPEPLALTEVVRAAAGRIVPYTRVSVLGDPDVAAAAGVVEPLIHLVAELLANATQSSPPATQVQVTVRTVQRGAVIEIDDGGVGMDERRLEAAREVASGRRPVGLGDMGEIPQTGLAVAGQYARRHGLRVDLMPSAYGGVRAVVLVPAELTEILDPAGAPPASLPPPAPPQQEPAAAAASAREGIPPASATTLPQRRSRRGETAPGTGPAATDLSRPGAGTASPPAPGADGPGPAHSDQSALEAGEWMSSYLAGQRPAAASTDARAASADIPEAEQRRQQP